MTDKELRKKDFKLGCLHGRLMAENEKAEAQIQRIVFLSQRMRIWKKRDAAPIIRIFGYEVPLDSPGRGRCVDLMGYDKDHNLFIIELKRRDSKENIDEVINQINDYEKSVREILPHIQKEFEDTYFFPMEFNDIKKMIIAPREYYTGKKTLLSDSTIEYGHFKDRDINKRKPKDIINIHLQKKT